MLFVQRANTSRATRLNIAEFIQAALDLLEDAETCQVQGGTTNDRPTDDSDDTSSDDFSS